MRKKEEWELLELFFTFFRIGLFTFGGGYAMIALIEDICVERKQWITHDEMVRITVIAESTPGPIAINCATFVGMKRKGFWGAVAATVGVVVPSFLIIYGISLFLDDLLVIPVVANAFRGIKLAVGLLIVQAGLNMLKKIPKKPLPVAILAASVAIMAIGALFGQHISTVVLILSAGFLGLVLSGRKQGGVAA